MSMKPDPSTPDVNPPVAKERSEAPAADAVSADASRTHKTPASLASEPAPWADGTVGSLLAARGLLQRDTVAARIDGELCDLHAPLSDFASDASAQVEAIAANSDLALEVIRHSTAHVMASAVQRLFPGTQVTFGPATEQGFYYDFDRPAGAFSDDELQRIEEEMATIVAGDKPFRREVVSKAQAKALLQALGEHYKLEHLERLDDPISLYRHDDWVDLCKGPHVPSTRFLRAFKLTSVAGAYWRGDERNPMLQRIYGTAFAHEKQLRAHLKQLEEAKKRDHRKLGPELKLFAFHPYAPASPMFLPRGTRVYARLVDYVRALYRQHAYEEVITPQVYDNALFRTSGHLPEYADNMYFAITADQLRAPKDGANIEARGELQRVASRAVQPNTSTSSPTPSSPAPSSEAQSRASNEGMALPVTPASSQARAVQPNTSTSSPTPSSPAPSSEAQSRASNEGMALPVTPALSQEAQREQTCCETDPLTMERAELHGPVRFGVKPMNCPAHALMFGMEKRSYRELPLRMADFGRLHRYERSGVVQGLTRVRTFAQDDAHIFCTEAQMQAEMVSFLKLVDQVYTDFGFSDVRVVVATRPDKRIGKDSNWDRAEQAAFEAIAERGLPLEVAEGEGAFYGPKIEFHLKDAIGREWQLGTIQVDFNLPERFQLRYVGQDNQNHVPVMLHRAILGSLERFFALLLEHCSGAFPTWLAPEQIAILTVSEKFNDYAHAVRARMDAAGIRATVDESSEKLGAKIRHARLVRVPFMAVIGEKEVESDTLSLRVREGQEDLGALSVDAVMERLVRESLPPSQRA